MNALKTWIKRPALACIAGAIGTAGILAACACEPRGRTASSPASNAAAVAQPADDPYPGVNTVARDRGAWQQLLSDHAAIRRVLRHAEKNGVGVVETLTESDDPAVAARIKDHALAMQARMRVGAMVRVWDPVFKELFEHHDKVTLEVTPTDKGVKIVETCADPETIALMRSHAIGVSAFVRQGHAIGGKATPRLKAGDPLPPDEVAIGGLPHRFLLSQPTPEQIALLRTQGVGRLINFRKHDEHAAYDESATAASAGATYCNFPFKDAAELTDDLLSAARAEYSRAAKNNLILAPHCHTGNRVGPGLAAYLAVDLNVDIERAISTGKAVGLVDPLYESITRDYIRRERAATSSVARVRWIGAMHKAVHEGDRGGKIAISSLLSAPHLYAIGPVAGLRGEITVIDGEPSIAVVGPQRPAASKGDAEAAFLAWAYVPEWTLVAIDPSVRTREQLEVFVLNAAQTAGLPADKPLVFRIEGKAQSLALHVIWHEPGDDLGKAAHDKAKVPIAVENADMSIIGFWSAAHMGIFTPMVSPFHMHARTADGRISGHIDDVQLAPGSELLLPTRRAADASAAWQPIADGSLSQPQIAQRDLAVEARGAMFLRLFARLGEAMAAPGADGQPVGPAGAIDVCKAESPKIAQAVAREKGVMIGRTSDRLRNPGNSAPAWAKSLLHDRPTEPRIAANADGSLGITLPITLAANCLACHGAPEQIDQRVRTTLAASYPNDRATGYAQGDLRGWFWVEVPAAAK